MVVKVLCLRGAFTVAVVLADQTQTSRSHSFEDAAGLAVAALT